MINKIKAVMFGHAVADAMGVPVEFLSRQQLKNNPVADMMGYGTYNMPEGCWSDDTSMALCELESLSKNQINYDDIMQNFVKWAIDQQFTPTGVVFDIGNTTREAIGKYHFDNMPIEKCGATDEFSNGNGSLMRMHPFVLYAYAKNINDNDFDNMIKSASALTHAHQYSIDGCMIYSYILRELLLNASRNSVYAGIEKVKYKLNTSRHIYSRVLDNDISIYSEEEIKSTGYVVDSLEAALWCLMTTKNYAQCILKAINLGGDTDTIGAIAGSLAGALYGLDLIPEKWIKTLKKLDYIEKMCEDAWFAWQ